MMKLVLFSGILLLFVRCQMAANAKNKLPELVAADKIELPIEDTIAAPKNYFSIAFKKAELLQAAPGTKSVLFNRDGSKLYAMNLEGLSIYEFDRATRKVLRKFKFKPTK